VLVSSTVHEGDDPMALPRVTLVGTLCEVPAASLDTAHAAFVDAHPTAASYAGFGDFTFWRLDVESVRYVGGYGRMSWVPLEAYHSTDADPLAPHADGIVTHMNNDHADACLVYAQFYAGFTEASSARLIGVDRLGIDLVAVVPSGLQPARVNFDHEQTTPEGVRKAVVALLVRARSAGVAS
jgi:putative heme iron utilization protein